MVPCDFKGLLGSLQEVLLVSEFVFYLLFDFTESNQGLGCVKKIFLFGFFPLKLIFPAENEWISINSRIYFQEENLGEIQFCELVLRSHYVNNRESGDCKQKIIENQFSWFNNTTWGNVTNPV